VAVAQSAAQVLVIRVSDRVGKGLRNSPRDALIADSVDPSIRGRAFGFNRTGDHTGGVLGPLIAFALVQWLKMPLRTVFWWAILPGALAVATVLFGVKEVPRHSTARSRGSAPLAIGQPLGGRFWAVLAVILVFTLGNSTDAFLLLRAKQLGVPVALAPILWACLHVVKSASSVPGGALSDRIGRKPLLVSGWLLYALVYFAFGRASAAWHAWALFGVYGIFFGLTEGTERALVADMVPADKRGTAFGWYNLTIGLGALPASIVFGAIWDRQGSTAAFDFGAALALAAALGITAIRVGRSTLHGH
jgi:MFS family permease